MRMCCRGYRDPVGHTGLGAADPAVPWPGRMPEGLGLELQKNTSSYFWDVLRGQTIKGRYNTKALVDGRFLGVAVFRKRSGLRLK